MKKLTLGFAVLALVLVGLIFIRTRTKGSSNLGRRNSMTYILDVGRGDVTKAAYVPTKTDIRKEVALLRDGAEPGFLILHKGAVDRIQVTCVAKDSFVIQSREGDEMHPYQTVKNLPTDATTKLLLAYMSGNPGWKKLADWKPIADNKETALPGRHLSEHQVADIVGRELPKDLPFSCQFKDGVWEILAAEKGVKGVSGVASVTTNADGKVSIYFTNATREVLVLKVRDADGKVEQVETP